MKNLIVTVCLIVIGLFGCEKKDSNPCKQALKIADIESSKGNLYYYQSLNYSEVTEYELFKKYRVIDYLEVYPKSDDSCFKTIMTKKIEKKLRRNIAVLNEDAERLKNLEDINDSLQIIPKFSDGIYYPLLDVERPILKYPGDETSFLMRLRKEIRSIDKNHSASSFWIVVNKKGVIKEIEYYKKYSPEVDQFIVNMLKRTRWVPSLNRRDSTFVTSRILFMVRS
ncbi:hypothetical protein [Flavobacterium sp.]|uniref:hypothetical protein n=1 Tax=Flavobacterium sp. TaxID=239 RepID=UPI002614004E|nr:hypothetical protein [Flavobacterium sp.]